MLFYWNSFWASIIFFKINSQTPIFACLVTSLLFHSCKLYSCWNIFTCLNVPCHFLYMENLLSYSSPTNAFSFLTSLKAESLPCSSTPSYDLDLVPLDESFIYLHRILCLLLCSSIDGLIFFLVSPEISTVFITYYSLKNFLNERSHE